MKQRTFIIGNGFDLDLGLNTSYRKFVESTLWPINTTDIERSSLASQLEKDTKENWFDLEDSLCNYAESSRTRIINTGTFNYDKQVYLKIKEALFAFIRNHERIEPQKESMAANVLRKLASFGVFGNILSFNYTDLDLICNKIGCNRIKYNHVHGSCASNSIIMGVSNSYKLKQDYDYMYKAFDPKYNSPNVRYTLQDVDEVVFYGHSLGRQDFDYFQDFFKSCSREGMRKEDSVNITFFTKDEDSEGLLKRQLNNLIPGGYGRFVDSNRVVFIHTNDKDSEALKKFFFRMDEIQKEIIRQRSGRGIRVGRT